MTTQIETEPFPFTQPAGSEASVFIQWKGTEVCMDFRCPCGADGHLDTSFAYFVHCPSCGSVFEMGTAVMVKRTNEARPGDPSVQTLDMDDF